MLSGRLLEHGLICRLDDRADPIVQLAPPLVAEAALLDEDRRDPRRRARARLASAPLELPSMAAADVA